MRDFEHPDPDVRLRSGILAQCFQRYEGTLAAEQIANNKLDLDLLGPLSELGALAVARLTARVRPYRPDLILPVPNGANWLGEGIGMSLGLDYPYLHKDPVTRDISLPPRVAETIANYHRIVIVEDVFNRFTNTGKVFDLEALEDRVVAVAGLWDRGNPETRRNLGVPVEAIITEHIPEMLPPDSPYWEYAS